MEWFSSILTIPGIAWRPPVETARDDNLAGARPVPANGPTSLDRYRWIGADGERISGLGLQSPCAELREHIYHAGTLSDVFALFCQAVSHPGRRDDYLEAVRFALTHLTLGRRPIDPCVAEWALEVCEAGMQLVESDPAAALSADRRTSRDPAMLAREPFRFAVALHVQNGYVHEALAFEKRENAALGFTRGPRAAERVDLEDLIAALAEL